MNVADRSKFFLAKLPQNIVEIVDCQLLRAIKTDHCSFRTTKRLKIITRVRINPSAHGRNIVGCYKFCVRLHTLLHVVAQSLKPVGPILLGVVAPVCTQP